MRRQSWSTRPNLTLQHEVLTPLQFRADTVRYLTTLQQAASPPDVLSKETFHEERVAALVALHAFAVPTLQQLHGTLTGVLLTPCKGKAVPVLTSTVWLYRYFLSMLLPKNWTVKQDDIRLLSVVTQDFDQEGVRAVACEHQLRAESGVKIKAQVTGQDGRKRKERGSGA